jgi:hypothetical protein
MLSPTDGTDATNYPDVPQVYRPVPTADSPAIRQELSDVIEAIPTIRVDKVLDFRSSHAHHFLPCHACDELSWFD